MKWLSGALIFLAGITVAHAAGSGMSAEDEAKALIGLEVEARYDNQLLVGHLSCRQVAEGTLFLRGKQLEDWSDRLVECQGRYVLMLQKSLTNREGGAPRYKVSDAVLLPPVLLLHDELHREGPYLYNSGTDSCALDGRYDTLLYAIAHEGKNSKMTWRSGIENAWTFDPLQGRIVAVSPKRVVCKKADQDD